MILLVHLLVHLGVPSGKAIPIVIVGRKVLRGAGARTGGAATVTATTAGISQRRRSAAPPCLNMAGSGNAALKRSARA